MNPLDEMTWEERFQACFVAFLVAEMRAEDAERKLLNTRWPVRITSAYKAEPMEKRLQV